MAGLQVGQAFGVLLLPGFGVSSSSQQVPGHPTSMCDSGVNWLNNKNYNFLDCDWFKKLLFSTVSLAKLLSDSSISQSHESHSLRRLEIVFIIPRLVLQILFQIQFGLSHQCEIYHRHK